MSKFDTMNSQSNLDCLADELFTELTPEAAEVIQGGEFITGRYSFDSLYINPITFPGSGTDFNGNISVFTYSTSETLESFNMTLQVQDTNGVFRDVETKKVKVGEGVSTKLGLLFPGQTGRLKFTEPGGFDGNKIQGSFSVWVA